MEDKIIEVTDTIEPWYDLGESLCAALGRTLNKWADKAMSYPPEYTPGEWIAELRKHSTTLLNYVVREELADEAIGYSYNRNAAEYEKYYDEIRKYEVAAKETFEWIGENLPILWD